LAAKTPTVYMLANQPNGTLYVGVTSNLIDRIHQHRTDAVPGFTSRYGCRLLVWFEQNVDMRAAIEREKQLKAGPRARKVKLIMESNPEWRDLFDDLL
jgi:putative endonuclease